MLLVNASDVVGVSDRTAMSRSKRPESGANRMNPLLTRHVAVGKPKTAKSGAKAFPQTNADYLRSNPNADLGRCLGRAVPTPRFICGRGLSAGSRADGPLPPGTAVAHLKRMA